VDLANPFVAHRGWTDPEAREPPTAVVESGTTQT
jgi:hypothetical protein